MSKRIALLLAGGVGNRMYQEIPKQFITINNKPIIVYTMEAFQQHADIDAIVVVCLEGWEVILESYARQYGITKLSYLAPNGKNGQESIYNGLMVIKKHYDEEDLVLIHDGIRPMVSSDIISSCVITANQNESAIAIIPCQEVMLVTEDQLKSKKAINRDNLKRTQTPQAFKLKRLLWAHKEAKKRGITNSLATCDLFVELGEEVYFSLGSEKNIKITTSEDLDIFKALLSYRKVI